MILADLHTHTKYCDGLNTVEEMVQAAIKRGMQCIGFSGHSYTPFDLRYCIKDTEGYRNEIMAMKEKYKDQIEILCGLEVDRFAPVPDKNQFDYFIGSVHYVKFGEEYIPVDEGAENLVRAAEEYCGGDIYTVVENYFAQTAEAVRRCDAKIIGHFDVLAKYQEIMPVFDETHPRYVAAYRKAMDELLALNKVFEVNVGAISRGKRTTPYPSKPILQEIWEKGGKFMLTGDSHQGETLCFQFQHWAVELGKMGIKLQDYTALF